MLRICCTACVATLVGCQTADTTIDITHDACEPLALVAIDANDQQRDGIAAAIALWQQRGVGQLVVGSPDAASIDIVFEQAPSAFHGLYDDEAGIIFVNAQLAEPDPLAIVIAHELGHAFGLEHVARDESVSVMNPGNLVTPPTANDQRRVEALWGRCESSFVNASALTAR